MESLFRYVAPPSTCGYLPDRRWSLEYEMVTDISAAEYQKRMEQGWRRFGGTMFRPQCPACQACQSLRVLVPRFRPDRSQRRARKANEGDVELHVGPPTVSRAKLDLYDRFHAFQSETKGWPIHPAKDPASYRESFVDNPRFTEEWCYLCHDRLIGVGYVDRLPDCLSAIYFYGDPDARRRSLGTYNVLCVLDEAARCRLPYVYLGYFVGGCPSLAYKANFQPNQILHADGFWRDFLGHDRE
jgi:arginyl-tRNA--protein-N-Asp/Glu arginylyltransferase